MLKFLNKLFLFLESKFGLFYLILGIFIIGVFILPLPLFTLLVIIIVILFLVHKGVRVKWLG